MYRLILGIFCLLISIVTHTGIKWELESWTTSPLPRPESALVLSGEFAPLTSDFFLVKAAIFYNDIINQKSSKDSLWLSKALYLASYLDPYYFEVYWMGGVVLPWEGRFKEAEIILKRGLDYIPKNWQIPFYLGFINFYFKHDNKTAARYFFEASKLPNSPPYLPLLASRLAIKGNETRTAIYFLQKELQEIKDKSLKEKLLKRLSALKAILYLEEALEKYKYKYGGLPNQLGELIKKQIIHHIPSDPYGGKFYLTKSGRVWTTSNLR